MKLGVGKAGLPPLFFATLKLDHRFHQLVASDLRLLGFYNALKLSCDLSSF
jgi:hypothetical protein